MARYNEILVGRFNRALQKFTGMKGMAPAPQISSEIIPVFQLPLTREWHFLEGWYQYSAFSSVAGAAAQNTTLMLRNPSTSGVIAVVERIQTFSATAGSTVLFQANPSADLANSITSINLDNRQPSTSSSALRASSATLAGNPAGANGILRSTVAAVVSQDLLTDGWVLVLPPGAGLITQDQTVNEVFNTAFWWRERPIEDSEKT